MQHVDPVESLSRLSENISVAEAGISDENIISAFPAVLAGGDIASHILAAITSGAETFGLQFLKTWLDQRKSCNELITQGSQSHAEAPDDPDVSSDRVFCAWAVIGSRTVRRL